MARAGAELIAAADVIAPVPLHRWRLVRRRYNQAAMLGNAIGRAHAKRVIPDLLVRKRATASQGHLGRSQRQRNVAGAFALHPGRAQVTPGARILLVDDVLTTGATAEACARVLRRAGAAAVDLLVLARVVRVQPG
jgi:ComF family protein